MSRIFFTILVIIPYILLAQLNLDSPRVKIVSGILEGRESSGVFIFKGIPFAQPPIGELRWKAPVPLKSWVGIRDAKRFGSRPMQKAIYADMKFRSDSVSEDCLYLNVWTPVKVYERKLLPVLVYFYGGGFIAGDGSELRYDGESMARNGIVVVTVNYRLGIFGFLAHPQLSKEAAYHGSGNYGLLDQNAALKWVHQNIAAFGGDAKRVTIAGESAGSISVSAQMASPLSKGFIAGSIGESGAMINPTFSPVSLSEAEQIGANFLSKINVSSITELRTIDANKLLNLASEHDVPRFPATIDGYILPKSPLQIFEAGEQAHVPLLVGWNSQEAGFTNVLGKNEPTPENYFVALQSLYGNKASEALKLYPGSTREEVIKSATVLAGNNYIGYSAWKWSNLCSRTGGAQVFRYFYEHPRPSKKSALTTTPKNTSSVGAVHSAEIEYALGNLSANKNFDWQPEDFRLSNILQKCFSNFIKSGNPNGYGIPNWPAINSSKSIPVMHFDVNSFVAYDVNSDQFLWLDKQFNQKSRGDK